MSQVRNFSLKWSVGRQAHAKDEQENTGREDDCNTLVLDRCCKSNHLQRASLIITLFVSQQSSPKFGALDLTIDIANLLHQMI
jgi:hypothetical protein